MASRQTLRRHPGAWLLTLSLLGVNLNAQSSNVALWGTISGASPAQLAELTLEFRSLGGGDLAVRAAVSSDGSFATEAADWSSSDWLELRVLDGNANEIDRQHLLAAPGPLHVRLEGRSDKPSAPGTVTLDELRRPVKGFRAAMRRSERALRRKDFKSSAEHYTKAAALEPNRPTPHLGLGTALLHLHAYQRALEAFTRALGIEPTNEGAQSGRAIALQGLGRLAEAEHQARAALAGHPGNARCRYVLGSILLAAGRLDDETLAHLEAASSSFPRALLAASRLYEARGSHIQAEAALRRCIKRASSGSPLRAQCMARLQNTTNNHGRNEP